MGQLEHFFPTAPRVLQQRRHNKQLGLSEDATARPSPASSSTSSSTKQQGTTSKSSAQALSSSARANPSSASKDEVEKASRQSLAPSKSGSSAKHNHNRNHEPITTAQFDDSDATAGDILNGTGSASSTTTTDTVFSERLMHPHSSSSHHSQQQYHQHTMTSSTLTPLTNTESSPRTKLASPSFEQNYSAIESNNQYTNRGNITPQPTPPAASHRRSARPPDLEPKGTKCVYDPDFDRKTPRDKKKKAIHENFGDKPEHNVAPRDPRQDISGYRHGYSGKAKAKLRSAPYTFRHWHHESVPSSPAPLVNQPSAVVVTGFDPMTPLAQITALFSSFGEISDIDHKSDPVTGRFLGICVITYQDCPSFRGGGPVTAQLGAKTAFLEGKRGQRVGLKTVKIELDREGLSEKLVEAAISKHRRESGFTTIPRIAPPPPPPPIDRPPQPSGFAKVEGPPPTAPKGPGGKASARASVTSTAIPQNSLTLQNKAPEKKRERDERATGPHVIEDEPIAETLTNTPYIFIACEHVPVLISTIGHLKKRLRMYEWKDIRADKTGYFLVFDPSRAGQTEAKKTYHGAHMHPLFTYIMHMEVNINGVIQPAVVPAVQPTPGVAATPYDLLTQKQRFAAAREREYDLEVEKRQRAQDLDPCRAVVQLVVQELREKLIEDVKSRLAAPLLYDYLDPDRHVDKRRKLGIEDPSEAKRQSVADVFGIRRSGKASMSVLSLPKIGKKSTIERGTGFRDERRKALPPRPQVRSLFHQLSQFNDEEESDDEGKTTVTRDTEDVDSRPASRMSMTSASSDDEQLIKKIQKRRLNHAREESEMGDVPVKEESAAVRQNADDLIIQKLERNIAELSPSSRKRKRLIKELEARKRQKADDELFGVEKAEPDREVSVEPQIKEPETPVEATPEPEVVAKALKKPKPKKKTKKEIAAEKEALRLAQAEAEAAAIVEDVMEMADEEEALLEAAERRPEVEWGVSADHPQPTVEDDEDLVPDIRGWQASLVDDEDLKLLADVLKDKNATNIGSSVAWAWKQEQIRHQYRDVPAGAVRREPAIQGYYKPNPTGSARTEGVKKILESEKSQYLPHRLKVQRDRQRREAEASSATSGLTQVKAAPEVPKASSRGKRADDRRAVKDIDRQRELLREHGDDADVVGYNQLQKRKKPVKFDRSAIHNWGLYTKERIQASEMIIEYVGERVRQEISELREIRYTESGIGSSYLFRIDETTVIDATKKGGIARFINHSCSPNCTAKIIRVGNTRRIVIYALTDIPKDTELTYDYKFEREMDSENRIPCLCGSVNCKGFLN